jgi:hypothetical protein
MHATHTKNCYVVPPEDGSLTPETCRGLRHNKVILKVKVYYVGYVIVIHNDTQSTKYQIGNNNMADKRTDDIEVTLNVVS